ncbi:RNA polymerase sigma factor FliA [mine drainage metagenome]|uniref:RNA polymerase sigma factor FliA n=1 Tax=mine drainage metagenome TaxID=410659 RepID=A0A1J5RGL0_9ZZZZ
MNIREFLPLVKKIATEMVRPLPPNVMLDDLIQNGSIGLINAFREHDADSGMPFHSYAANRIRWAIQDGLRADDWASRSVRRGAGKVSNAMGELQSTLGRKPTQAEIASLLGIRIEDLSAMVSDAFGLEFIRLDDETRPEVQDIPDYSREPSAIVERRMATSRAIACLKSLSVAERRAFILRVMCDMSGREAAVEMQVSASRISQLTKIAGRKLSACANPGSS